MTSIVADGCLLYYQKYFFALRYKIGKKWTRKLSRYIDIFLRTKNAKKKKVSESLNADKNGLGEYFTMNCRHFWLKFEYSEKTIKFEKIFHLKFDISE